MIFSLEHTQEQINKTTQIIPMGTKWAFTTRRVNPNDIIGINQNITGAVAGDLVLAKVLSIGSHTKTQLSSGRPSLLSIDDYIVLCCGDRYAPDQFEGIASLDPNSSDMLAGGGLIGEMRHAHTKMKRPTQLRPIGLLTDKYGEVVNIATYRIPDAKAPTNMKIIGVVGASMNAGKTTATASFAHGLTKAGMKVAGIKATGTGAFGDYNAMLDAGLHTVADFTDAGMASTYLQPIERIEQGIHSLLANAKAQGAEVAIIELADGIFQPETAELLEKSDTFKQLFDGLLFASGDALSVVGGINHLRCLGYEPLAVSGKVSLSPLAVKEAYKQTGIHIYTREELMHPEIASKILNTYKPLKRAS